MLRPAVFFDRDNTLIANSEYLGDPDRVVLLTGAAESVARVRKLGFATIVVSNQSGVARGMFDEDDVRAVNARLDLALVELHPDAVIEHHEFCAHHPEASVDEYRGDHRRRKPQPGMLIDAAESYGIDLSRSWMIGDAPRDIEAGHRAGCRTILVREPLDSVSPAARETMRIVPEYIASSLMDAVDFIEMHHDTDHDTEAYADTEADTLAASTVEADAASDRAPFEVDDADTIGQPDEPLIATMDPPASIAEGFVSPTFTATSAASSNGEPINLAPHAVSSVSTHLGVMKAAITSSAPPAGADKQTILLLERIVDELRRGNDPPQDFSVARMLAGIVQGFAIASLFAALLFRDSPTMFTPLMLLAIFLQAMVSSLVLMGR